MKLIAYSASGVTVVSSNPSVGPLTRIKIYFFLLSACTEKLLSTPNIIAFLPIQSPLETEELPHVSIPILYPE